MITIACPKVTVRESVAVTNLHGKRDVTFEPGDVLIVTDTDGDRVQVFRTSDEAERWIPATLVVGR